MHADRKSARKRCEKRDEAKDDKEEGKKRERRKQIGRSSIFPASFRPIFGDTNRMAEQEDGGYDASSIRGKRGRRRAQGGRWRTKEQERRKVEVSDRQAKLARPSRGFADVK